MITRNFALNQPPYELPTMGHELIVLIIVFLALNYATFKLFGLLLKIDTTTGNDSSKIVYLLSFMVSAILTFFVILPFLKVSA